MNEQPSVEGIRRVLITGGRETGGLQSFAVTLAEGFTQLGLPAEVIPPRALARRWRELRDASVLKILSTTAVFAVPFARRAICVAHGYPRPDAQGWIKVLALIASFRLAASSPRHPLVAVSFYTATHLQAIYDIGVTAVIHNPLRSLFLAENAEADERCYLTYVGRLHPVKNVHRLLPAMRQYLDESPGMRICVVGDGALRAALEQQFGGDPRVEFTGELEPAAVRAVLRKTHVFLSGGETEPFGIVYLEAMSQGCSVVMPACGGGLEIAPEMIGGRVQIIPLSFETSAVQRAIRQAHACINCPAELETFTAHHVAQQYLSVAAQAG